MHSIGVRDPLEQPPSPIYRRKGEEVAAQLAQASRSLPLEVSYAPPKLISSPPFFVFYGNVTEAY